AAEPVGPRPVLEGLLDVREVARPGLDRERGRILVGVRNPVEVVLLRAARAGLPLGRDCLCGWECHSARHATGHASAPPELPTSPPVPSGKIRLCRGSAISRLAATGAAVPAR